MQQYTLSSKKKGLEFEIWNNRAINILDCKVQKFHCVSVDVIYNHQSQETKGRST